MQLLVQITFRNMETSEAVETRIRQEVAKLEEFFDGIMTCRVMVELPHQHRAQGKRFHIRIDLMVPGDEIVVNHEPSLHSGLQHTEGEKRSKEIEIGAPHKDIYVAIRDAFKTARRQLQDYVRKQTGVVKQHEPMPRGRVRKLSPEEGYGFLETLEGEEVYFHQNSVLDGAFTRLTVGTEVSYAIERGDKGPQASTVRVIGNQRKAAPEE